MEEVKYDKSRWAKGEWDSEPDRVDFVHVGYACLLLRNNLGNWCGYVAIPSDHPLYGKKDADVNVHGGLSYAAKCSGPICHAPEPGMPDDVWWLGFDTAHVFDVSPALERLGLKEFFGGSSYKNLTYVRKETESLAEQLRDLKV